MLSCGMMLFMGVVDPSVYRETTRELIEGIRAESTAVILCQLRNRRLDVSQDTSRGVPRSFPTSVTRSRPPMWRQTPIADVWLEVATAARSISDKSGYPCTRRAECQTSCAGGFGTWRALSLTANRNHTQIFTKMKMLRCVYHCNKSDLYQIQVRV